MKRERRFTVHTIDKKYGDRTLYINGESWFDQSMADRLAGLECETNRFDKRDCEVYIKDMHSCEIVWKGGVKDGEFIEEVWN